MSVTISVKDLNIQITAQPLTPSAFAPFGDVITNPRPDIHPSNFSSAAPQLPDEATSANQGTAIRYGNVSRPRNLYSQAPSRNGSLVMSQFICAARTLAANTFPVTILERHPFTTQTFSPLCVSPAQYLVIVAPSMAPGAADADLPVPDGLDLPGRGVPDVRRMRAFVASGKQAVTYGAGTWHAPMVALGEAGTTVDFLVVQFASGVAVEDCQLVVFEGAGEEVLVRVPAKERLEKL